MRHDSSNKYDFVALVLLILCIWTTASLDLSTSSKVLVVAGFGFGIYVMLRLSVRATLSELFPGDSYRQSVLELLASLKYLFYLLVIGVVWIGYVVATKPVLG